MSLRSASTAVVTDFIDTGHHFGSVATSTTITLDKPAGAQPGELLIAFFDVFNQVNGSVRVLGPIGSTWTELQNFGIAGIHHVLYHVVSAADPASWAFRFRNQANTADFACFSAAVMGCWTGFASPYAISLVNSQDGHGDQYELGPNTIVSYPTASIHTALTSTGGFVVTGVSAQIQPENFDGSNDPDNSLGTGLVYPAVEPWVDIAIESPDTEHAQIDFNGTPRGAGEDHSDEGPLDRGVFFRTGNATIALGSQEVAAGAIPDSNLSFVWQHCGNIFGYGSSYFSVRVRVNAIPNVAYWGINASTPT